MKYPIILRADDGIGWWTDAASLESYVESPDIDNGIYTAWDADGQILNLVSAVAVNRKPWWNKVLIPVSSGTISETGRYEPEILYSVIACHIKDIENYKDTIPSDLDAIVNLLCRLRPASR